MAFRGPLLYKPVTDQELFFAVSYRKLSLEKKGRRPLISSFIRFYFFKLKTLQLFFALMLANSALLWWQKIHTH